MKILIIGYGSIGRRHFRNLLDLGIDDIIFLRTKKSTLPDEEINNFPVETNLEKALDHQPQGVIIATPTAAHLDAAIPVAKRGLPILLEKPISHTMDQVEEFKLTTNKTGSKILVGFQFRFHPNLLQLINMLKDNVIGRPLFVRSHWGEYLPDWHPWEDYRQSYSARNDLGGGVLLTLCHSLDYLTWIFGIPTVNSSQLGYHSDLEIEVEDTAELSLRFSGDLIGSLHLNYIQIPPKHTLEIIGSRGSINWDYYQNSITLVSRKGQQVHESVSTCPDGFHRNDLFLQEMKHFLDVVNGDANPICDLDDGIINLKLIQQAKEMAEYE
jgi:predicted dehydrogenase